MAHAFFQEILDMPLFTGSDSADTLTGTSGADTLVGNGGADALRGGAGDDVIVGGQEDKVLDGGAGVDLARLDFSAATQSLRFTVSDSGASQTLAGVQITGVERVELVGGSAGDWLTGGALRDGLEGREGNDWLKGLGGDDSLSGGGGFDILDGGTGADTLDGGAGQDQLTGGAGDDVLFGVFGDVMIDGGDGSDLATLDFGIDTAGLNFSVAANLSGLVTLDGTAIRGVERVAFTAGHAADQLGGGALADTLTAGAGADSLAGGGGGDRLLGDDGADTLAGGAGDDLLEGGAGVDRAQFSGQLSDYRAELLADGAIRLTDLRAGGPDGVDLTHDVEIFQFSDRIVGASELLGGGANRPPVAGPDNATTDQNSGVAVNVLANDSDPEGGPLRLVSVAGGVGGSASLSGDAVLYAPNLATRALAAGQTLVEHLTYRVADQLGAESVGTLDIVVTGLNDAPTAVDDSASVDEDATVQLQLFANDSDLDAGDSLTLVSAAGATKGQVIPGTGGEVTYRPGAAAQALAAGQTTVDSFTYVVRDAQGATSTATAHVLIHGANDAPFAVGDAVNAGAHGATVLSGLVSNDIDPDQGDTLRISGLPAVSAHGATLVLQADGSVTYDPGEIFGGLPAGQTATDSFTYTVTDAHGASSTATVNLTVTGGPVAEPDLVIADAVLEDGSTDNLLGAILEQAAFALGEPVTLVSIDTTGLVGSVTHTATELVYTADAPSLDALWGDGKERVGFLYTVQTASGALHTGGVQIDVFGVNDAPAAQADAVSVGSGSASANLWSQLLANDHDPDVGQLLDISAIDTAGALGRITFDAATQSVVYHADTAAVAHLAPGQTLTDTFHYTLHDEEGATSIGLVTVTVSGASAAAMAAAEPPGSGWVF